MTKKIEAAKAVALSDLGAAVRLGRADQESAHMSADQALCDLLVALDFRDVVEEYHKVPKWYA